MRLPAGEQISRDTAIVYHQYFVYTIEDTNQGAISIELTASPAVVSENSGATAVAVTATVVDTVRPMDTTVDVMVEGGGGSNVVGFAPVEDFQLTIPANALSGTGTFTLTPQNDTIARNDETVRITGDADLDVVSTSVRLEDDDEPSDTVNLSVGPPWVSEGNGATEVTVTATLNRAARDVETRIAVAVGGSGESGAVDFTPVAGFEIVIAAGDTEADAVFELVPEDDHTDERDETLTVDGESDLDVTAASLTLADNDEESSRIVLSADPARVSEGAGDVAVKVTAELDASARTVATTVTVSVSGSGDAGAVDFDAVNDFEIVIPAGMVESDGTLTLVPEDDQVDEKDETLTVAGASDLPVTGTSVVLADDDETSQSIALSVTPNRVSEGDGEAAVTVTAALDAGARAVATTVTVSVSASGDADAVDFDAVNDFEIVIPAGMVESHVTLTLVLEDDNVDETDETLAVAGTSDLPVTGTSVVLADDDETSRSVALSVTPDRVSEGDGEAAVTVTAALDAGARAVATTVTVSVSGSGDADAVDFDAVNDFEIVIAAGMVESHVTLTLVLEDDNVDETDETLAVAGTSDLPVTGTSVVLADDDETSRSVALSVTPNRVSEGDGEVTVTVTAALDAGVRAVATPVTVSVRGSGDADAVDFEDVDDFEIVIPAGIAKADVDFTLVIENDSVDEADETLTVSGASSLPVKSTSLALTDDDETSMGIALSVSPDRVSEEVASRTVAVTATLDAGARTVETTVSVSVNGSGRADAVDFDAVDDFRIVIPANATNASGSFELVLEDDGVSETDETLTVSGDSDLPVSSAAVTLTDDDSASTRIALSAVPGRISEGDGTVTVTVTAALGGAARTVETTVMVSVAGTAGANAVDFEEVDDFRIVIPDGELQASGAFTLVVENDRIDELDESLQVEGTSDLPVTPATVVLADDDETPRRIALSVTPNRVSEGDGDATVTVTAALDAGARAGATPVTVSVRGSGDADAVDFEDVASFEIVIPAGGRSAEGTFTLVPEDDRVHETDETLAIAGTSDLPVTGTSVVLADDDETSRSIALYVVPAQVSEGDGATPITVTAALEGAARTTDTAVTVSVVRSGNAGVVDFADVASFEIVIPAGDHRAEGTFTLVPEDDRVHETDETLAIAGTSDLPVTGTSVVLADDDETSRRIALYVVPVQVSEGDGATPITVTAALEGAARTTDTAVAVSVVRSGNAGVVDFADVASFEIVIPTGGQSAEGTFTLVPEDDRVDEADETVEITGTSDLPVTSASVIITDNDATAGLINLAAAPARVSEHDGSTRVTVTAALDGGARTFATPVTVSVTGSGNPDAVDFAPVSDFRIVIAGGATRGSGTFALVPEDDDDDEVDETLIVRGVADLRVVPTTVVLVDDDQTSTRVILSLSARPARISEGDGPTTVTVTGSLDGAPRDTDTVVAVSVSGGGEDAAVDFTPVGDFEIRIRAGALSGESSFVLVPEDDRLDEMDETVTVSGTAELAVVPALLTLVDNDRTPMISVNDATVIESADEVAFTVSLDPATDARVTVEYATADTAGQPDAATAGADYQAVAGTLTFAPGSILATIRVPVIDDTIDEPDEKFLLLLDDAVGAGIDTRIASGTIRDDDEAPVPPVLSVADAAATESDGELAFAVRLDRAGAGDVSVDYATMDGTAVAGADYRAVAGTLTFAPGSILATIRVPVIDDTIDEPDEKFLLLLDDAVGAGIDTRVASGTIRDDDEAPVPPVLSVADAAATESDGELAFAVRLDRAGAGDVSVDYATMDGTAVAGADYRAVAGTFVFAPGQTEGMIQVPLVDDALDEPPEETLVLTLVDPSGATLAAGSATGTIRDDDETPALSIEGAAGDEDVGELAFDVTLSAPSGRVVTVRYATFDGTAMSGDDFVPAKATLTLEPGVTSAAIRVVIVDDIFDEPDETFVVGLADPLGASLATGSATGTIRDNDIAPPTANATMPDVRLCVGGADHRIDLAHHFSGEMLRFTALSSAPDIAAVSLADGLLAVRPVSEGEASVTLTAVNEAGEVSGMFIVHVVSDPAELVAVDGVLAGVGRSLLNTIVASIDARFELNRGSEPQPQRVALDSASGAGRPRSEDFGFVPHNFPGTSGGSGPVRSDGLRAGTVGRRSMAPFSFSAAGSSPATSWSVWGRGGTHRFESPGDEMGHKGTHEEVRAGIDARFGNWLAGISVSGNRAVADYNFVRSLAGCGTSDAGTGIFETELMSVQPYAGRSMGSGWLWATVGTGRGEAVVERCGSGMRGAADLAMHTVAMGGRHPVAAGDRFEWSLVEDVGVLRLATDAVRGPVGDRDVTVGQARIGVQLGVAPARRSCPLTTWVRASARRDWGDGSTGVGVEFAAGPGIWTGGAG